MRTYIHVISMVVCTVAIALLIKEADTSSILFAMAILLFMVAESLEHSIAFSKPVHEIAEKSIENAMELSLLAKDLIDELDAARSRESDLWDNIRDLQDEIDKLREDD